LRAEKSIVETQRDAARLRDNAAMVSSLETEVEQLKKHITLLESETNG
jgi:hypothetical protein